MVEYEYRVIPAPVRRARLKGLSRHDDKFAVTLAELLNEQGREGWSYVRTDTVTERRGRWPLRSRGLKRELIVFQREKVRLRSASAALTDLGEPPRKSRRPDLVEFVRGGGRKIAATETPALVTAAE